MIKYGIIGCGNIGSKRIEAIAKDKDSKLEFVIGPKKPKNLIPIILEKKSQKNIDTFIVKISTYY